MEDFKAHLYTTEEVLDNLEVDDSKGLSDEEVLLRQEKYGLNELEHEEGTSLFALVLEQFDDMLVQILLIAAMMSFVLAFFEEESGITAFVEPFIILFILIINAIIGVWQESNAENALERLKEMQSDTARCLRNGVMNGDLKASELVPGDVVELWVGDKVPADLRILELLTTTIRSEESALTGESKTILKDSDVVPIEDAVIADMRNMFFTGTSITNGKARCVVVRTGMKTELGKIQAQVQKAKEDDEKTPLGKKIDAFSITLTNVIAGICLLVWIMNIPKFYDPVHGGVFKGCIYYLKIAVALGVAAIPEGLPAVITLCLSLGTRKMVKRNCIVRKLPSVETLGCTTVICSDKTGTLTTNQMTVKMLVTMGDNKQELSTYNIDGHSYTPHGNIGGIDENWTNQQQVLGDVCRVSAYCNDAKIEYKDGKYVRVGNPTEAALKVLVEKLGLDQGELSSRPDNSASFASDFWCSQVVKTATLEFSRDRKSMSVLCYPSGSSTNSRYNFRAKTTINNALYTKGAPERILERCSKVRLGNGSDVLLDDSTRDLIESKLASMADKAYRCLALAVKEDLGTLNNYNGPNHSEHSQLTKTENFVDIESDMVFIGLVGIEDPPRPMVRKSIEDCKKAGIRVIMITGDNQMTAESIARKIGMFEANEDITGKSFTGQEFLGFDESKQIELLMNDVGSSRVFSRAEPTHKQVLVKLLKDQREIVAMTGDGVNDAPALQQADIGIAMGIAGTEVAKEASAMILVDDNFSTIVAAVEEGRSIYQNMKAFIRYLISSNIGEVASIFLTAALGLPEGLIPVQLLWVNLVTDGPPATALGFNQPDPDVMKQLPRKESDKLISGWVFFRYMVIGIYVGLATVGIFVYWYLVDYDFDGHTTVTFDQLRNWGHCTNWEGFSVAPALGMDFSEHPCRYFTDGKLKASTLSLTVLVVIEMLNAFNALSEDGSLLSIPPWSNPYLILAVMASIGTHFLILYIPFLSQIFSIVPLTAKDWEVVMYFSFPVIILDEMLKFFGRWGQKKHVIPSSEISEKKNV